MSEVEPRVEAGRLAAGLAAELRRREWIGTGRIARSELDASPPARPDPRRTEPGAARAEPIAARAEPVAARAEPIERPARARPVPPEVEENRRAAEACDDLEALRARVASCTACELCRTRTQTVFADGPANREARARVMFVGEAPGQHEDEKGIPFVGRAGQLLSDIVVKGMGLAREEVYIANVLKCRPPGNRDPRPEEKALCTPFLDRQIELVDPEVLITLGLHASQHVLSSTSSLGRLRGRVHLLGGRKVVATYHPAFLLRSPDMKKECWKDVQIAMHELGLSRP